ncbi:MAG TPA: single-stranded DNA-binding protein [Planctomycetaceae bacterium]|nr:single-stranded DNA-binding protein [Planctomycetaceae bacterium]
MASFNRVILMGNLTRDPQVRYTPGGTAVAELGLAVNRTWFDKQTNTRKEDVTFVDVTLWGRTAEIAGEYLGKGRQVLIEGRLQTDSWDDKETGQKRSKLKVVCENMTMVGGRGEGGAPSGGGGGGQRGGSRAAAGAPADMAQSEPDYGGGGGTDYSGGNDGGGGPPDDEVPF